MQPGYRTRGADAVVAELLLNGEARGAYFQDRPKYLRRMAVPAALADEIMRLPDESLRQAASRLEMAPAPTFPCSKSTFADLYCDG